MAERWKIRHVNKLVSDSLEMERVSAGRLTTYLVTCIILIWKSDAIVWAIRKSCDAFLEYLVGQLDWFASAKPAGG